MSAELLTGGIALRKDHPWSRGQLNRHKPAESYLLLQHLKPTNDINSTVFALTTVTDDADFNLARMQNVLQFNQKLNRTNSSLPKVTPPLEILSQPQ